MARVAVLGLGLLGSGFVEGLLSRGGTDVVVWNRTKSKADPLVAMGATVAETPADAVKGVERVHLILLDDDIVDATIEEFMHALDPATIIVDHTTTRPDRTAARAAALDKDGFQYLHAPVMMGPGAARLAKGIMLVAGPSERFARVRDALTAMTGELWHVGERPDLAAVYKLCGNATILPLVGIVSEVMRIADAAGVDRPGAFEMISKINLNGSLQMRGSMMVSQNFDPQFTLNVARKDLRLMLETAGATPMPMLRAFALEMDELIAAGKGERDVAIVGERA